MNVEEAFNQRMKIICDNFDTIILSFSGGKDSGVVVNMALKYIEEHNLNIKPILFHQDVEAQYTLTSEYVERTYEKLVKADKVIPYWCCQSIGLRVATSVYQYKWLPWDEDEKDIWTRPMPNVPYIKTNSNFKFEGFYKGIEYHKHFDVFADYVQKKYGGRVISLSGVRTQESLNRYRAVMNKKHMFENYKWTLKTDNGTYVAYPIYDWKTEDIWICNAKYDFDYNKIYDKMYMAGATINQMRVASPFNDSAQGSLAMFKIIEPEIWDKLLNRVQGAAFTSRYGNSKLLGKNNYQPPNNLDWRQFTRFLLRTLPKDTRNNYVSKFITSSIFWHKVGGGLGQDVIDDLLEHGYKIRENGTSPWSKNNKKQVCFRGLLPLDTDDIQCKDVPSWKRMCKCILKNDYACVYMGFGLTGDQAKAVSHLNKMKTLK